MVSRLVFTLTICTIVAGAEAQISSSIYHTFRQGIPHMAEKLMAGEPLRVAYLGGSITFNGGWRDSLNAYFTQQYPELDFDFINAGIPSMGSTPGAFRMGRDVLSNGRVDLLFLEAAVNDATNGRSDLEQQRALEGIIRQSKRTNPEMDIVLMHFVDPTKMRVYRKGQMPRVIENHELIAEHYQVSSINLAKEVTDRVDAGEFSWEEDFVNLHPSPFGQGIYARSMLDFLNTGLKRKYEDPEVAMPELLVRGCYDAGRLVALEEVRNPGGWQVIDAWTPVDGAGTRSGYTDVSMLVNQTPNASIFLDFSGDAVGVAVASGPDAGIIDFRIDGGPWQRQNLFTRWSRFLHLPWYYTLAAGLSKERHVLELKVSNLRDSRSMGSACRIKHFFVNEH